MLSWVLVLLFAWWSPAQAASTIDQQLQSLADDARAAQSRKDFVGAAADYGRMVKLVPHSAELWANLGIMYHLAGNYGAAVPALRHAVAEDPSLFPPNFFLGVDLLALQQAEKARPYLQAAHRMKPDEPVVLNTLARDDMAMGDMQEANALYARATAVDPGNAISWFGSGATWFSLMRDALNRLQAQPDSPYKRALLAETYQDRGNAAEAGKLLADASTRELLEPSADCHGDEPACDFARKHYAEAAAHALQQKPFNAQAQFWYVRAARQLAMAALARAEELAPDSLRTHLIAGEVYLEQENFERAKAEFERARTLDPAAPGVQIALARVAEAEGQDEQAMQLLKAVLQSQPSDAQASFLMARVLLKENHFDTALPYAHAALKGEGANIADAHAQLARIYEHDGNDPAALAELVQAQSGDRDGSYHYRLYRLYQKEGRTQEAATALQEYKKLHAHSEGHPVLTGQENVGQLLQ